MKTLAKLNKKGNLTSKEASRLVESIKNNITEEAAMPFMKSFLKNLVKEQEESEAMAPNEFTPETDRENYENSLDPNTPKDQFDVEGIDPQALANAISSVSKWSSKLDEFVAFLNDTESQSLAKLLAAYDRPGSLVKGITRKTSDSITRVAGELAKLKQTLDGFVNLAPKKQRDTEALVATGGT